MARTVLLQARFEQVTARWRFMVALLAIPLVALPFASRHFSFSRVMDISRISLGWCFNNLHRVPALHLVFKLVPVVLVVGIFATRGRFGRAFSAYAGFSYVMFALVQNVAVTPMYGLSVMTSNVVLFMLVAASWLWDCKVGKNDFSTPTRSLWRYWVVPPALLAFWSPVSERAGAFGAWEFSATTFFTSEAGMAFCLMTPLYLAVLSIFYPRVNLVTMRVTSAVGLFLGLVNMVTVFGLKASPVAVGICHIPLVLVPAFTLYQSLHKTAA